MPAPWSTSATIRLANQPTIFASVRLLAFVLGSFLLGSELRAQTYRDPADQPFRRAPMSVAARSIVLPLATNVHLAFDTETPRTHTAWRGPSLNLHGKPYDGDRKSTRLNSSH